MQKFIKIESKGVIDPQAFILIGASTKRQDDTKIGFFGSGLKYSVSYMLRNNINFKVFAEYKEIKFNSENVSFRNVDFKQIYVDGIKTSMTTEMGMDWEAWFVIREIYCNALDEGDSSISFVTKKDCVPVEEKTVFYIEVNEEFKTIIDKWDSYFSENRKDLIYADVNLNQLYSGGNDLIVYRKGIRCLFVENQKCIFNYDLTKIKINESRVISSEFDFKWDLSIFLKKITDKRVIGQILNTINDRWEKSISWDSGNYNYSEEWREVVGGKTLVPYENAGFWEETIKEDPIAYVILPGTLVSGLKGRFLDIRVIGDVDGVSGTGEFKEVKELTKRENFMLEDSIDFLTKANYTLQYPVKVVDFVSSQRLGQAKDKTILLSRKLFNMGKKELISALIEEQEHLETGYEDESRAFQTHFIYKLVSIMEELSGKYL